MPTTHGHGTNISCIFSNSPQSIVGCGDSTHRCRRRRHRTQAGTKRFKQHKRNNKIFSDTCASKGRRGRRPLQGRCVQCNHADNARAQRKHSSHFLKFSAVHCRGAATRRTAAAVGGTERRPEQNELSSTNETIKFSVALARQRVVRVADPYRVGAYNAIIPTTHGYGTNISCIFSNSLQSLCRVRRLDAPLPPSAAQNASSKQSELNSMNIANAHSAPNFGLSNP